MRTKTPPAKTDLSDGSTTNQADLKTSNRKFLVISFALAAGIFLAVYLLRMDRIIGLFVDDAWYAMLAKSLATGQGYQLINSPTPGILPVYPPVYPFLMSLAYRLWPSFPDNVLLLKSVSVLAMFVIGWASYKHFHRDREWPHLLSLVSALTVTLMPGLVFLATSSTMSECVFTAFQLLAVIVLVPAGWWIGRRMTRPVASVARFIERIGSEDPAVLHAELPRTADPELGRIAGAVDRLIGESRQGGEGGTYKGFHNCGRWKVLSNQSRE